MHSASSLASQTKWHTYYISQHTHTHIRIHKPWVGWDNSSLSDAISICMFLESSPACSAWLKSFCTVYKCVCMYVCVFLESSPACSAWLESFCTVYKCVCMYVCEFLESSPACPAWLESFCAMYKCVYVYIYHIYLTHARTHTYVRIFSACSPWLQALAMYSFRAYVQDTHIHR